MATLRVPNPVPSPTDDAENLRKACQGWGTDENAIISILGHRDSAQRKRIRIAYEELYQEDLIQRLESELSGDFENAVYRWTLDPPDRDAVISSAALNKLIPDIRAIIEIACVRTPSELLAVKQAYHLRFKRSLEEDVASNTTGNFRKLLVALVGTYRYGGDEINTSLALQEANILHDAIQEKAFDHEEIIRILSTRSKVQLHATFNCYKDEYGTSITKGLLGDPLDEFLSALRTTVRCINSPHKYFEKVLRNAINNLGTDEDALTRVIIMHAEKDLKEIMEVYHKRNNVALSHAVANDTSGDYKNFLLTLLGE
ncbi:annexin-like protein RJ4 [Magnolia sinica]|uniref:annexin-like protein RJ4 n=1 Tax=Magnolia sinica TaxID=86752 RepID=UPI00265A6577|nr:annexin-like protein RJ4 [Magnolia sinica]